MSKRAEELRIKICKLQGETIAGYIDRDIYFQQVDFMIDAELRKERERAAKRFCHACSLAQDADSEGCSLHESCAHCMLILSDEED